MPLWGKDKSAIAEEEFSCTIHFATQPMAIVHASIVTAELARSMIKIIEPKAVVCYAVGILRSNLRFEPARPEVNYRLNKQNDSTHTPCPHRRFPRNSPAYELQSLNTILPQRRESWHHVPSYLLPSL
jgi:hypothetical protein